jgi:hypothetical protein
MSIRLPNAPRLQDLFDDGGVSNEEPEEKQIAEMDIDEGIVARMADSASLPVRWLGHTSKADLFEQYEHWHLSNGVGKAAGKTTFRRVWIEKWRGILKIRKQRQHAQCNVCAELALLRTKAQTDSEKRALQERRQHHLSMVFADRSRRFKMKGLLRDVSTSCRLPASSGLTTRCVAASPRDATLGQLRVHVAYVPIRPTQYFYDAKGPLTRNCRVWRGWVGNLVPQRRPGGS